MYFEIQKVGKYYYGLFRSSYREGSKVLHITHSRVTGLSLDQLKLIQGAIRGELIHKDVIQSSETIYSKEYGASYAILTLAKELGLDKIIYSRYSEQWVKDCLAMIVGRLVFAGSKLFLSHCNKITSLWEQCGISGEVDVNEHCYGPMDHLLERQESIQKQLIAKHCKGKTLVLYDITSSYFEGEYKNSNLVEFGHNRDKKRGYEQVNIGLICDDEGCPLAVEVFPGNLKDSETVINKIEQLQTIYGFDNLIFTGDRGMFTSVKREELKGKKGLHIITAMTHPEMRKLLQRDVIQIGLFDDENIVEVIEPDDKKIRYCLCRNNASAERETKTRKALLDKTKTKLNVISNVKNRKSEKTISMQVGRVLQQTKMSKFVEWKTIDGRLEWKFNNEKIEEEQSTDGCYIITTDIPKEQMDKIKVVESYKSLQLVEQAFRNIKTVQLEIRPAYHKTDDRIRCHVFVCMLAYYLQWHMKKRLQPLFNSDGKNKDRKWTFNLVIETLKSIRKQTNCKNGITYHTITSPDNDQQKILDLLGIKLL
jgi:transposase